MKVTIKIERDTMPEDNQLKLPLEDEEKPKAEPSRLGRFIDWSVAMVQAHPKKSIMIAVAVVGAVAPHAAPALNSVAQAIIEIIGAQ